MNTELAASLRALALACALAIPAGVSAQPTEAAKAEFAAAVDAANKASVAGPSDVKLADQALLKLPAGLVYYPPAQAGRLLSAMGNRMGEGVLGMVISPDADWFIVMRFNKSGYIKDDDAREWNVDDLLKGMKEGTEESNKERKSRGLAEIEVVGWVEAPKYEATTHRLVWALESKERGAPARRRITNGSSTRASQAAR